jgi:hypothetical protein
MFNYQFPIVKPEPKYSFNLSGKVVLGFVANLDESGNINDEIWIDFDDQTLYKQYFDDLDINHKNIVFECLINNRSVLHINLTDCLSGDFYLNHNFTFSKKAVSNILEFKISGFSNEHMLLLKNQMGARPAIKIDVIDIENVDILPVFAELSKFYFDSSVSIGDKVFICNGSSRLVFETPIYKWLLKHKNLLC